MLLIGATIGLRVIEARNCAQKMAQAWLDIPTNKRGLESPFLVLALCVILPCSCRLLPNEYWSLRASWLLNEAFTAEKSCNLSTAEHLLKTALSEFPKGVKRNRRYAELEDRLGSVLLHEQRPAEALKYLDDALYIRFKILSPTAPEVADSFNNVANCMISCGLGKSDFLCIEQMFKQVLKIDDLNHRNDKYTAFTKGNLARLYGHQAGMASEAKHLFEESIQSLRRKGVKERITATLISNYADFLSDNLDYTAAEKLYKEANSISIEVGAESHPDAIGSLRSLGKLYINVGRDAEAKEVFAKVKALQAKCSSLK